MKIGIIGNGVVGHAIVRCFMEYGEVRAYDIEHNKCSHSLPEVLLCDLIFVCLPSPMRTDSKGCDTSKIESFFQEYIGSSINFVLKSTVPIGTTKLLKEKYSLKNLVHSPEFLTARCAVTDAMLPSRNIIGGHGTCADLLETVYLERFPGIQTYKMSSDESEAVKLFQNSFFATKIAFFNEMSQLCKKIGLDFDYVKRMLLADGRIAHNHTNVPGPDGKLGYGNGCLPKDINNLIQCFNDALVDCPLITSVEWRNRNIDRKD
jgi:UDPglucose 6-dehydrogenase